MKYLYPAAAFVFLIFFVSCSGQADSKESLAAPVLPATTNPVLPVTTNPVLPVTTNSEPAKKDTVAAASTAGVTLNPQHGQPGHRCDIAVGAPLTSPVTTSTPANFSATPPASSATTTTTTLAKPNTQTQPSPSKTSGTALNPKHGEPGHRCDIAVGAPLNSKATQ